MTLQPTLLGHLIDTNGTQVSLRRGTEMEGAMEDDPLKDFLTVGDVADRYGVEKQTVRIWLKEKRLPAIRKGHGVVLIPKAALDTFTPPREAWFDAVRTVLAARKPQAQTEEAEPIDEPSTERTNQ